MEHLLIEFHSDQFVHFVHSEWIDHTFLPLQLASANPNLGKSLFWRGGNPALVNNEHFRTRLMTALDTHHANFHTANVAGIIPRVAWDQIKALTSCTLLAQWSCIAVNPNGVVVSFAAFKAYGTRCSLSTKLPRRAKNDFPKSNP